VAVVYVNHGRWVVDCPNPDCFHAYRALGRGGRQIAKIRCRGGAGRVLGRPHLRHKRGCGLAFELEWPDDKQDIEQILALRPAKANRNWRPPETVATLISENETFLVGWTLKDLVEKGIGTV